MKPEANVCLNQCKSVMLMRKTIKLQVCSTGIQKHNLQTVREARSAKTSEDKLS